MRVVAAVLLALALACGGGGKEEAAAPRLKYTNPPDDGVSFRLVQDPNLQASTGLVLTLVGPGPAIKGLVFTYSLDQGTKPWVVGMPTGPDFRVIDTGSTYGILGAPGATIATNRPLVAFSLLSVPSSVSQPSVTSLVVVDAAGVKKGVKVLVGNLEVVR